LRQRGRTQVDKSRNSITSISLGLTGDQQSVIRDQQQSTAYGLLVTDHRSLITFLLGQKAQDQRVEHSTLFPQHGMAGVGDDGQLAVGQLVGDDLS